MTTHHRAARRRLSAAIVAGVLTLTVLSACGESVTGRGSAAGVPVMATGSAQASSHPTSTGSGPSATASANAPSATTTATRTASPRVTATSTVAASATCPAIVDPKARLAYACLDDDMINIANSRSGPTTHLAVLTEENWGARQSSRWFDIDGITTAPRAETVAAAEIKVSYEGNASITKQIAGPITVSGYRASRADVLVTLDSKWAKANNIKAKQDMLTVVVVAFDDGTFSALIITAPDTRKDWWDRYDAVVASLRVV